MNGLGHKRRRLAVQCQTRDEPLPGGGRSMDGDAAKLQPVFGPDNLCGAYCRRFGGHPGNIAAHTEAAVQ